MIENLDQNQIIFVLFIMALSAIPVGFMAGLFGIGGGLITVPVLFYIFNSIGIEQEFIMHLAVGTSFSIIIPPPIPIGADKKPEVNPDKIFMNKFISFLIGLGFSFETRKNKEKIIVIICFAF